MKNVLNALVLAVLATVSLSSNAFASNDKKDVSKSVKVVSIGDAKFRLALAELSDRSSIYIKDYAGSVLYSETVRESAGYKKIFDLSTLRDGRYSFVVLNGDERIEKPFELTTSTVRTVSVIE